MTASLGVALGPAYRAGALRALADTEFDVLVVGGGVTGAGAALDAVSRGLTVALVEARDWAAGTSSRSSKLIHGGLRYLEQLDFTLVREALAERSLLLTRLAPHLVRPVPFLVPLQHRGWERFYIGAGVSLYDVLGGARSMPRHRYLSRRRASRIAPALRGGARHGAIQYFDAQADDARYTVTLARTAASYGAVAVSRAAVTGFLREGERVTGASVTDLEDGHQIAVRARRVISAAGVWTSDIHAMAGVRGDLAVRASKGVHIVVPRDRIRLDTALILRAGHSVLLVIPWGRRWLIGSTDTDWDLDKAAPAASRADVDYLLDRLNAAVSPEVTRDDVVAVYAGLRPLLAAGPAGPGAPGGTAQLSREHAVSQPVPGLVVIAGGKFTTYRVMARDAVDAAAAGLPTEVPPSVTERLPLMGADGYEALWNERGQIAGRAGLHPARVEHLLNRYGSVTGELLDLIAADPALGRPIGGADDYLRAEAVYAASAEGALHLEDILARRMRIAIEEPDAGAAAALEVASLVAPVLGWDSPAVDREVSGYLRTAEAERSAGEQADDVSANAARMQPLAQPRCR
jgi:glycerol-3-phosphate dehydrogenase